MAVTSDVSEETFEAPETLVAVPPVVTEVCELAPKAFQFQALSLLSMMYRAFICFLKF